MLPQDAHLPFVPPQGVIGVLLLLAQSATTQEKENPAHHPKEVWPIFGQRSSLEDLGRGVGVCVLYLSTVLTAQVEAGRLSSPGPAPKGAAGAHGQPHSAQG